MSQLEEIKARVAGHTPGPWGVHADTHEYRGGDFMQVEPKVGARTICEVTDQHKANADLIAAAPKLLAALEAVEAVIAEHEARTPFPDADKESQWYSLGKRHGYERVRLEITEALQ